MILRVALAVLVLSTGCAMIGAPEWAQRGYAMCGPIRCRGVVSAVGKAEFTDFVTDSGLRRQAAASAARVALLARIEEILKLKDTDPLHLPLTGAVNGAEVIDRWILTDGTELALVRMNRMTLHLALAQQPNLAPEVRDLIEARMDPVFASSP